ncbi:MAG: hypothetical protein SGPRY_006000 [Prymnesium sp.]
MSALLLLPLLSSPSSAAVRSPMSSPPLPRRAAVLAPPALLSLLSPALPAYAVAAPPAGIDRVKLDSIRARSLRDRVRTEAARRRSRISDRAPGAVIYQSLTDEVRRQQKTLLVPLTTSLAAIAATADLPKEKKEQLKLQPLLLKGHLLELDQALAESKFDSYVSKTTKATYPGGKVERELEEVCETLEDFLALAYGREVDARED